MANRTMLVAASKIPAHKADSDLETIGLSEFAYDVPLIYQVLASGNPQLCYSTVFEMDTPLAVAGDAKIGLQRLTALKDALPKDAPNRPLIEDALTFLSKAHHDYPYYLIEPAEVFDMSGEPLDEQMKQLLQTVKELNFTETRRIAAGDLNYQAWATDTWTNVLFFGTRGGVEPPKEVETAYLSMSTKQAMENADKIPHLKTLENLNLTTAINDPYIEDVIGLLAQIKTPFQLNLNGRADTLPEAIGKLTQVSGLSMGALGLKSLPESLGKLTQLTSLQVSRNELTELPEFVRGLPLLETINVSENMITTLPEWISEFADLNQLNLMGNPISRLPDSVWQMEKLQMLYLGDTKITSLPEEMAGLKSLRSFNAASLGLTSLPDAFWTLTGLGGITLKHNPLGPRLPEEGLRKLTKLKQIDLMECGLEHFPEAFCEMPDLVWIDARKNKIANVPQCMREKRMDWIGLQGNPHSYNHDDFNSKALGL